MPVVRYVAKRSLVSAANGDTVTYTLPIRWAGLDKARSAVTTTRTSLLGNRETYYYRADVTWNISTIPLKPEAAALLEQFLDSAMDGQVFSFSRNNSPTIFTNAVLSSGDYSRSPDPGFDSLSTYGFSILEVP